MKKLSTIGLIAALILSLAGFTCSGQQVATKARNTLAASQGAIQSAQSQFSVTCKAQPAQAPCVTITKAVAAQNVAVTTMEIYCGWLPGTDPASKCAPVQSEQAALESALANLGVILPEIQALITPAKGK